MCRIVAVGMLFLVIECVAFPTQELNASGFPKQDSDVWGKGTTGAAMEHGIGCMCLGCQGERSKDFQKEGEESRRRAQEWAEEAAERDAQERRERMIRAQWDAELKAMGVVRWSYSSVIKFKSPRVKATIIFSDGRRIDYNQKIKHGRYVPTPVEIASGAE